MTMSRQLLDLQTKFGSACDDALNTIDCIGSDLSGWARYFNDNTGAYLLSGKMLAVEDAARQLIYKAPDDGVRAYADYLDLVLLLSERIGDHFPSVDWVVDRHLGGVYAMGDLPVKDVNRSLQPD